MFALSEVELNTRTATFSLAYSAGERGVIRLGSMLIKEYEGRKRSYLWSVVSIVVIGFGHHGEMLTLAQSRSLNLSLSLSRSHSTKFEGREKQRTREREIF